jgi:ectoine hydroxylase-related dioxygenase (phytanoyl-CoA dioxygenase family)
MTTAEYATTAATLSDEQVATYRQQGFIHIPGVIAPHEVATFHAAAVDALQRLKERDLTKGGAIFTQLVNVWQEDERLRQLTLHPNVGAVAERLAGLPLRLWHDHLLVKQPHNNAATEFHQDLPFWPFAQSRHTLSAWIALVDVPVERGCMTFIPGSHQRAGLRPQNLHDEHDLFSIAPELVWFPRVTLPLRAGDCTFHHGLCAHMATPNHTDDPRIAHVIIFADAETTYSGSKHIVSDPLGLASGDPLDGPLFPRVR